MNKALIFASLALLLCAKGLPADETVLPSASLASPLQSAGQSARALSLGGAFAGIADDASSLYWNPAGLGSLKSGEWSLHHSTGFLDGSEDSLILAWPFESAGALGFGADWVNYGAFTDRDSTGIATATSSAYDLSFKLGWGGALGNFGWGLAGSYLKQNLGAGANYASYAADLGATWDPMGAWRIGLSAMNLGSSSGGTALSSEIRLGTSYLYESSENYRTLPAIAYSFEPGGLARVQLGLEERLYSLLALRAGYQWSMTDYQVDGLNGLTAGVGLHYAGYDLDYAYLPFGNLGTSQRISLGGHFDAKSLADVLLPPEPATPLVLAGAAYVGVSAGESYFTGYNAASLSSSFNQPGFSSNVPDNYGLSAAFWGGWQFPFGLVLEAGGQVNPARTFAYGFSTSGSDFKFSATYTDYYAYLLSGYRWVTGPVSLFTAGLKIGENLLSGSVSAKDTVSGISASSSAPINYSAIGLGPVLRWERLLGRHASLGLELGYDFAAFSQDLSSVSSNSSSTTSGANVFDYSSVYGRLTLSGWFSSPLQEARPSKAAGRSRALPVDPAMAQKIKDSEDLRIQAEAMVDQGKQFDAMLTFKQSLFLDPANLKAWQGLGTLYMNMNRKSDALPAYHKALDLDPTDTELRAYIIRLEAQP